MSSWFLKETG